jgi:DNA (cytosine-5)-methyltransferase 1
MMPLKEHGLGSIVDLVKKVESGEKNIFPEKVDIIIGGFPCQDFSNAGKRNGFSSHRSHTGELIHKNEPTIENRGTLYIWMRKVIETVKPKIFIAENVKALTTLPNAHKTIEDDFRNINGKGYIVISRILHAAEYGVPQTRERIIFFGFLRSALKKDALKALESDQIPCDYDPAPQITHKLREKNYTCEQQTILMNAVPVIDVLKDLPEPEDAVNDLSQHTHSKAAYYGDHCQGNVEIVPEWPCFTIRAQHHGNIEFRRLSRNHGGKLKDELNKGLKERRLTVRECARIQTFPDDYEFVKKPLDRKQKGLSGSEAYMVIGNAVPPLLGYHIASRLEELWPIYFKKNI